MTTRRPTALIADDEPLLRRALIRMLVQAWPELLIVQQARNGREAVAGVESLKPDICFLDVHMPGWSGVEAARRIGTRAHLVFVTAYSEYAVQAFEHGALDYLVKPVEAERLAATVERLQERLRLAEPAPDIDALLTGLTMRLEKREQFEPLQWIRASVGPKLRLIPVERIDFLRSTDKYTQVAWRDDNGEPTEALVRKPLKQLLSELNRTQFVQIHRSIIVNLHAVSHIVRVASEKAEIHLKGREDILPVSRTYVHQFRQM